MEGLQGLLWRACEWPQTWRWRSRRGKLRQQLEGLQREQQGQECRGNSIGVGSMELELLEFQMELEQSRYKSTGWADEKWWLKAEEQRRREYDEAKGWEWVLR